MRLTSTLVALTLLLAACRGDLSTEPPVHINPNMDNQDRLDPQEGSAHFEDGRGMRPEVPGAIARGAIHGNPALSEGSQDGKPLEQLPVKLTAHLLARGKERYNIHCSVCHGEAGVGDGIAVKRGMLPPPSFHQVRLQVMPVGQIYRTISKGVRNMRPYGPQIPVQDRWAIVSYVRALQVSRTGKLEDVPADIAAQKGWKKP